MERLKAQWTAEIDILLGENTAHATALLKEIKAELLDQIRPIKLNEKDPSSEIHLRERSFEKLCFLLRKNNIINPENLSTYSFYSTVQFIKEEAEQKLRKNG